MGFASNGTGERAACFGAQEGSDREREKGFVRARARDLLYVVVMEAQLSLVILGVLSAAAEAG